MVVKADGLAAGVTVAPNREAAKAALRVIAVDQILAPPATGWSLRSACAARCPCWR